MRTLNATSIVKVWFIANSHWTYPHFGKLKFRNGFVMSPPNMVMESGVHASLHPHCHHQIILAKFDLKVFYPPPYERTMWHFSQANSDRIKKAVDLFDWESALINLDVNEQVPVFNDTIINIMLNFVPNEVIICDNRVPPWMKTSALKWLIF